MKQPTTGQFKELFDVSPVGMVLLSRNFRIVSINRAALRELEIERRAALGHKLTRFFPEVEQKRLDEFIQIAFKLSQRSPHEIFQSKTRGGRSRFVELSAVPVEEDLLVILHNVTKTVSLLGKEEEARVRAEEFAKRLKEAEFSLQMALEAGGMGVWQIDHTTSTLNWSYGLHPLHSASRGKSTSIQEFLLRIHPKDRDKVSAIITTAGREEIKFSSEYRVLSSDGSYQWILARGSSGGPSHVGRTTNGVWLDITARKLIEGRVKAQYEVNRVLARSINITKAAKEVLRIVGGILSHDVGIMWLYDKESKLIKYLASWKANQKRSSQLLAAKRRKVFRRGQGLIGKCENVIWLTDLQANPDGLKSGMIFPILVGEEVLGVVEYYSRETLHPDKELTKMATLLGNQIGQFVKRVETREELVTSKAQLEAIFQSVSDGIAVQDTKGNLLFANSAAENMNGFVSALMPGGSRSKKILGKFELINEQGEPFDKASLPGRKAVRTKKSTSVVLGSRLLPSGSERWNVIKSSPVLDSEGNVELAVNIFHDITQSMLEQKSRDMFLGIASHELKTPMAVIKAYAQLAKRKIPSNGGKELGDYVNKIDEQVNNLTTLINDLLDATRIRSGKLVLLKKRTDVEKLVRETVQNIQLTLKKHKIEVSGKVGGKVQIDPNRISQVLINLLKNAVKYSPDADRILITLSGNADEVIIKVKDFGIGISPENQKNIFKPLFRVEDSQSGSTTGLGLGLFITASIINAHGGNMKVESKLGKGSTFSVILPRKEPNSKRDVTFG